MVKKKYLEIVNRSYSEMYSELYSSALHYINHIAKIMCQQDYENKLFVLGKFSLTREDFKGLLVMLNKVPCPAGIEKIR